MTEQALGLGTEAFRFCAHHVFNRGDGAAADVPLRSVRRAGPLCRAVTQQG